MFVAGNVAGLLSYAMLFGAFFVLPFVLERAYGDSPWTAGLQLSVIPAAFGLVAPLSGALYDRLGARFLTVSGMVAALVGLLALSFALEDRRLTLATTSLAPFGIGQGLFNMPNNSATPWKERGSREERSGQGARWLFMLVARHEPRHFARLGDTGVAAPGAPRPDSGAPWDPGAAPDPGSGGELYRVRRTRGRRSIAVLRAGGARRVCGRSNELR